MNKITLILLFLNYGVLFAQQQSTLFEIIELAKTNSAKSKIAQLELEKSQYGFKSFQADYSPQISASGTTPAFDRRIQNTIQQDGSLLFTPISQLDAFGQLSARQKLGFTGGEVFASSSLQRYESFDKNFISYNATPGIIGVRQPIFKANPYKWDKKIEPLKLESAKKQYVEAMEEISIEASNLFFDLLLAQISLNIAEKNRVLSDTLYNIAKGRYNLGKIAENELLQMQLSKMNAESDKKQSEINVQNTNSKLVRFLNMDKSTQLDLILPEQIPLITIDTEEAYQYALENKARITQFEIQKLESEKQIAIAKSNNRYNADLSASYGFANSAQNMNNLYQNPLNQQGVRLSLDIPLWNNGKNKSEVKIARANNELIQLNIEQSELNFEQELKLFFNQFSLVEEQLKISFIADTIAEKRYDIAVKRYMIGKTGITDLNIALNEKNLAKRSLMQQLSIYWDSYFRLRFYTLYDFIDNQKIIKTLE